MQNTGPFSEKFKTVYEKVCAFVGTGCSWIFKLRKLLLALPVVIAAIRLASENADRLPETVGLNLQSTGEFAIMVTRGYAVSGPLLVTGFCLLLMFCSRKTVFPWVISVFSLALPYLIYLTNIYAG